MRDTFIETFHTETFHGLTIRFEAHVDEFFDEKNFEPETAEDIQAGVLELFTVRGVIEADGTELASDWLGSVIGRTYTDFLDGTYDDDMRVNLIKGAQYKLSKLDAIYRALPVDRELFPVSRCG